ncbi:unnamed protein product, partial [Mesorhabditis spiculigera]
MVRESEKHWKDVFVSAGTFCIDYECYDKGEAEILLANAKIDNYKEDESVADARGLIELPAELIMSILEPLNFLIAERSLGDDALIVRLLELQVEPDRRPLHPQLCPRGGAMFLDVRCNDTGVLTNFEEQKQTVIRHSTKGRERVKRMCVEMKKRHRPHFRKPSSGARHGDVRVEMQKLHGPGAVPAVLSLFSRRRQREEQQRHPGLPKVQPDDSMMRDRCRCATTSRRATTLLRHRFLMGPHRFVVLKQLFISSDAFFSASKAVGTQPEAEEKMDSELMEDGDAKEDDEEAMGSIQRSFTLFSYLFAPANPLKNEGNIDEQQLYVILPANNASAAAQRPRPLPGWPYVALTPSTVPRRYIPDYLRTTARRIKEAQK